MTALKPPGADSWTFEDLLALPESEDGTRYELIDGRLLVSALPALPHYRAVNLLHRLLIDRVPRRFLVGQMGGVLQRQRKDTYLIPDIMITPVSALKGKLAVFAPAEAVLVVEVLSPSSGKNDNLIKRYHYARMGIPHYWIVDPEARELHVMNLAAGQSEYVDEAGVEWLTKKPFPLKLDPAEFC
jgi:Uma2 family endonuclease